MISVCSSCSFPSSRISLGAFLLEWILSLLELVSFSFFPGIPLFDPHLPLLPRGFRSYFIFLGLFIVPSFLHLSFLLLIFFYSSPSGILPDLFIFLLLLTFPLIFFHYDRRLFDQVCIFMMPAAYKWYMFIVQGLLSYFFMVL